MLHPSSFNCRFPFPFPDNPLLSTHDSPSPNQIVCIPCKKRLSVGAPCETHTLWLTTLLSDLSKLGLQLVNLALLFEVEDNDAAGSGGAEPVSVGREDEGVDLITGGEGVKVLRFVQVPKHGCAIFAAGGAKRTIRGDGDCVDVARVADVVGLDAARGEFPDLFRSQLIAHSETVEQICFLEVEIRALVMMVSLPLRRGSEVANT